MSNPPKATMVTVSAAYQRLLDDGITPTADRIQAVTGGSKTTVVQLLQELLASQKPSPRAMPEQMEQIVRAAAQSIWSKSYELADRDITAIRSACSAEVALALEQCDSSSKVIRQLQDTCEHREQQLEAYRRRIAEQEYKMAQIDDLRRQVDDLRLELRRESMSARQHEMMACELRGQITAMTSLENRETHKVH
jgi:predicted RNase H-like nuclease (RuvC/YqgF family)